MKNPWALKSLRCIYNTSSKLLRNPHLHSALDISSLMVGLPGGKFRRPQDYARAQQELPPSTLTLADIPPPIVDPALAAQSSETPTDSHQTRTDVVPRALKKSTSGQPAKDSQAQDVRRLKPEPPAPNSMAAFDAIAEREARKREDLAHQRMVQRGWARDTLARSALQKDKAEETGTSPQDSASDSESNSDSSSSESDSDAPSTKDEDDSEGDAPEPLTIEAPSSTTPRPLKPTAPLATIVGLRKALKKDPMPVPSPPRDAAQPATAVPPPVAPARPLKRPAASTTGSCKTQLKGDRADQAPTRRALKSPALRALRNKVNPRTTPTSPTTVPEPTESPTPSDKDDGSLTLNTETPSAEDGWTTTMPASNSSDISGNSGSSYKPSSSGLSPRDSTSFEPQTASSMSVSPTISTPSQSGPSTTEPDSSSAVPSSGTPRTSTETPHSVTSASSVQPTSASEKSPEDKSTTPSTSATALSRSDTSGAPEKVAGQARAQVVHASKEPTAEQTQLAPKLIRTDSLSLQLGKKDSGTQEEKDSEEKHRDTEDKKSKNGATAPELTVPPASLLKKEPPDGTPPLPSPKGPERAVTPLTADNGHGKRKLGEVESPVEPGDAKRPHSSMPRSSTDEAEESPVGIRTRKQCREDAPSLDNDGRMQPNTLGSEGEPILLSPLGSLLITLPSKNAESFNMHSHLPRITNEDCVPQWSLKGPP